ncbi:MAG TPA: GYF domain-containing protein [Candidatus Obscuribacterales bacterium]
MSGAGWYFAKNNQQQGPVPEEELRKLLESRELSSSALVWTQGMGNWVAAKQVERFADIFAAPLAVAPPAPPPLPPAAEPVAAILAATSDPAAKTAYADGGFEIRPESFQFQQPGLEDGKHNDGHTSKLGNGSDSKQPLTAEERSARLRKLVAETPAPSGNKWGDLDSIATPGAGAPTKSELDAIPNPGLSALRDRKTPLESMPASSRAAQRDLISPEELVEEMPSSPGLGALRDLKSQLDAIPTPGAGPADSARPPESTSTESGSLAAQLDSIPTPGSSRGLNNHTAEQGNLVSKLDAIATPASNGGADHEPAEKTGLASQLNAIPTPGAGRLSDSQRVRGREGMPAPAVDPKLTDSLVDALDAIPTPGTFKMSGNAPVDSADLASQLDSIPTPGNSSDGVDLRPRTGLKGSGKFRKLSEQNTAPPPSQVDTGSFVKGTGGSNVTRRTFSKLVPIARGNRPKPSEIPKQGDIDYPHPWNRAWARFIDDQIYSLPTLLLMILVTGTPSGITGADLGAAFTKTLGILFVGFLIKVGLEAVVLGQFGTSIGKRCFSIQVKDASTGEKIGMWLAIKRTLWLTILSGWIIWGIPVVGALAALGCGLWQYSELTTYGKSSWDAKVGARYEHHPRDPKGNLITIVVIGSVIAAQLFCLTVSFTKIFQTVTQQQSNATTGGNSQAQPTQPLAQPVPPQAQPAQTHAQAQAHQHKRHKKQESKSDSKPEAKPAEPSK